MKKRIWRSGTLARQKRSLAAKLLPHQLHPIITLKLSAHLLYNEIKYTNHMASTFSFDVVSDFDKAEMNNVLDQANRELDSRYDFKGTPAKLEWLNPEKSGFKITGNSDFQIDSIIEIIRKKLAARGISQKVLDESKDSNTNNFQTTKEVPFRQGLDQEKAKKVTALVRDSLPKVKTQIQGVEVRVTSAKKDELQQAMQLLRDNDFDFPLNFTNFR